MIDAAGADGARWHALVLATSAFAVNFWAWSLLSPLAPDLRDQWGLSPTQASVLVAVPVLVGSLGRIPLGAATDRYGGRNVFTAVCLLGALPVIFLALTDSYSAALIGGFLLGLTGASFAVGVPFVNSWFPPQRRGLALGVFGVGNAGTAISGFLTPWLVDVWGRRTAFLLVAAVLVVTGAVFLTVGRDAPRQSPARAGAAAVSRGGLRRAYTLRTTWELAGLYALTFGGFVAFGVYLPTYLTTAYDLSTADAAARTAGFVVLATATRPVGGWAGDRFGGARVLHAVFTMVAAGAAVTSLTPPMPVATVAFLTIAAMLGIGNGAIFSLLAQRVEPARVGAVTGVVGAAGGLGGFFPPLVMGLTYEATGSYAIGLALLAATALTALGYSVRELPKPVPASRTRGAG